MSNTTNTVHPVKYISREEKMDQLLNKMVECFRKAFPTAKDLAQWLAEMNSCIFEDKNAKDAKDASNFTFDIGYCMLPELIKAKTDRARICAIKDALHWIDPHSYAFDRALQFIIYIEERLVSTYYTDTDYINEAMERVPVLKKIAELGKEHSKLKMEINKERVEAYKKEREDNLMKWYFTPIENIK